MFLLKILFAYQIEKHFLKPRVITHVVHNVKVYMAPKGTPLPTVDDLGGWPEEWKELGKIGTATFRSRQEYIPRIPSGKDSIHITFKSPKRMKLKQRVRWELAAITQERPQYKKPPVWATWV